MQSFPTVSGIIVYLILCLYIANEIIVDAEKTRTVEILLFQKKMTSLYHNTIAANDPTTPLAYPLSATPNN